MKMPSRLLTTLLIAILGAGAMGATGLTARSAAILTGTKPE